MFKKLKFLFYTWYLIKSSMPYTIPECYKRVLNTPINLNFLSGHDKEVARNHNNQIRPGSTSSTNYGNYTPDSRVTSNGAYMSHCYFSSTAGNPVRSFIG